MYIEHAYQQTQQVWPVEYEDQLTLLTSLESAEQYTHEHGGTIACTTRTFSPARVYPRTRGNHPRPPPKALRSFVRAQGLVFRF